MSNQIDYKHWLSEINKSNSKYERLFVKNQIWYPIFFFGDPKGAVAATVGANPSVREFDPQRKWGPEYCDLSRLIERCQNYFKKPAGISAYLKYFQVWEDFLRAMGSSYYTSPRAVHLDFSPRATCYPSSLRKKSEQLLLFNLLENDFKYFVEQLKAYPAIKHLYLAGTVTKRRWTIDVLKKCLDNRIECVLPFRSPGQKKPYVGLYKIDIGGAPRALFFCSTSPSSYDPSLLPQKAYWLKKHYPEFVPPSRAR